jgi:hypothetical protein
MQVASVLVLKQAKPAVKERQHEKTALRKGQTYDKRYKSNGNHEASALYASRP